MGRYYSGDINGKFWFGVQSSNAADRFGVTGQEPNYLEYSFDESDKQSVEDELKEIKEKLGDQLQKIDEFFNTNYAYNTEMLKDAGINEDLLEDYADYQLGKEILECLNEQGYCEFTAEL